MTRSRPRPQEGVVHRLLRVGDWLLTGSAKRLAGDVWNPRRSTNSVLRTYLKWFGGRIINVSGWEDADKEGGFYRDYFGRHTRYAVSNVYGVKGMPAETPAGVDSLYLDLNEPVPEELRGAFDVAFSHTVIEHIFDPLQTLQTMADLSQDVIVAVVPFSQSVHYTPSYADYVRLTPLLLKRFFEERGFTPLLCVSNDQPFLPVYTVFIASSHPERYAEAFADAQLAFEPQLNSGRWGRRVTSGLNTPAD